MLNQSLQQKKVASVIYYPILVSAESKDSAGFTNTIYRHFFFDHINVFVLSFCVMLWRFLASSCHKLHSIVPVLVVLHNAGIHKLGMSCSVSGLMMDSDCRIRPDYLRIFLHRHKKIHVDGKTIEVNYYYVCVMVSRTFSTAVGLFSRAFHILKGGFCFLLVVQSFLINALHFSERHWLISSTRIIEQEGSEGQLLSPGSAVRRLERLVYLLLPLVDYQP